MNENATENWAQTIIKFDQITLCCEWKIKGRNFLWHIPARAPQHILFTYRIWYCCSFSYIPKTWHHTTRRWLKCFECFNTCWLFVYTIIHLEKCTNLSVLFLFPIKLICVVQENMQNNINDFKELKNEPCVPCSKNSVPSFMMHENNLNHH